MTRRQLSIGEVLAAAAGAALMLATFLPWFEREATGGLGVDDAELGARSLNAWRGLGLLTILIVLVAAVPLLQVVRQRVADTPPRPQLLVAAGAVAVTLVLGGGALELGSEGAVGPQSVVVSTTADTGLVVSVVAALVIAAGGVAAMWGFHPARRAPDEG